MHIFLSEIVNLKANKKNQHKCHTIFQKEKAKSGIQVEAIQ